MSLRELQDQVLKLPTNEKWQLVQTLLSAIRQDTTNSNVSSQKNSPLRGLSISISDDFDESMSDLWEELGS